LSALLLASCAGSRGGPVPYDVQNFGTPDAPEPAKLEDYKIEPMDGLRISVFQVTDLSGEFEVDLNGEIAFPLIGTVKAADMTTRELQTELKERLRKFVHEPVVSVAVKPSAKRSITVDGSVRNPGMFPVTTSMTLIQAIALASGVDERANPRRIAVFRRIGGRRLAAAFDLESIRRGQAEDPEIYSGDIIVVDGSKTKAIQREILQTIPLLGLFRPF
jgi:polysaccharide export outer membrane protein